MRERNQNQNRARNELTCLLKFKYVRKAAASVVILALGVLISGVLLLNCPFLTPSTEHASPCCPRQSPSPSKCPLAPTMETCPYFITEAKLGYVEAKVLTVSPFIVDEAQTPALSPAILNEPVSEWAPAATDLHVRNRVLRI
jgi:hypothetical protein